MPDLQEFHSVLPLLVKLSLWCTLPFALKPLLARWSAARRHLLLTLVLAGSLALPALWSLAPSWSAPSWLRLPSAEGRTASEMEAAPRFQEPEYFLPLPQPLETRGAASAFHRTVAHPHPATEVSLSERRLAKAASAGSSEPAPRPSAGPILFLVWILGLVFMMTRLVLSIRRAAGIVGRGGAVADATAGELLEAGRERLSSTVRPRLLESSETTVPFAWGSGRGSIVLPTTWRRWSPQRLEVVVVHELAHLRRRDSLALAVGRIATALWWFLPMVHILDAWARRECEQATDDAVLLSGSRASEYAYHLIAIGRSLSRPLPAGVSLMMSNRPNLKSRLLSILRPDQPRQGLTRRIVWGASLLALGSTIALAGIRFAPKVEAQEVYGEDRHGHRHDHETYTDEGSGGPWEQANAAHSQGRYDEAIAGFEKAAKEGIRPATSTYNAACGYALTDRPEEALANLGKALRLGLDDLELLTEDSDLDPLRSDPRFQALVDKAFADAGETRDPMTDYRYRRTQETLELLQQEGSRDSEAWAEVGTDLLTSRRLDDAVVAFSNAVRFDREPRGNTLYNLACAHALAGQKSQALNSLEKAIHAGYSDPHHMQEDSDLRSLRGDPRFQKLTELAHDLDLNRFRKTLWEERSTVSTAIHWVSQGDRSEYSPEVWAPAIKFYRGFTAKNPEVGIGWFNLGYALHYSERFEEAGEAFNKARDHGFRPSTSTYNVACGLSMLNRVDEAIAALQKAIDLGFNNGFEHDSDLENLKSDDRFRALARKQEMRHEHG